MSVKPIQLDKEYPNIRHNTNPISFNCPGGMLCSNKPGRQKTFKTFASLDSHFSLDHKGEFWIKEARILLNQFAEVMVQ